MESEKKLIQAKLSQMHTTEFRGMPILIEWPAGLERVGTDEDGKTWRRKMHFDYGHFIGVNGKDDEGLDCYIGPYPHSDKVYIVEQLKANGETPDEFKVMLGFDTLEHAQQAYLVHYPKGWEEERLGDVFETDLGSLRTKVEEHQEGDEDRKKTATLKKFDTGEVAFEEQGVEIYILPLNPKKLRRGEPHAMWTVQVLDEENRFAMTYRSNIIDPEDIIKRQLKNYLPIRGTVTSWTKDDVWLREWKSTHKENKMGSLNKTEGLLEKIKGTEYDMAGSKLSGFWHDGPATCMDCRHRTPHSKNAEGVEVDSCKHPVVMVDPELQEKKLPDGTIEVDADDWCRFAQKPVKKEEKSEPAKPETPEKLEKKPMTGSIYFKVLNSIR